METGNEKRDLFSRKVEGKDEKTDSRSRCGSVLREFNLLSGQRTKLSSFVYMYHQL